MQTPIEKIQAAFQWTIANRPKVGGFPYLAEALRKASVTRYTYNLPSGQCLFFTEAGVVANTMEPIASGMTMVPKFNREGFIRILRVSQNGDSTFPEFLEQSWENGVISYEADLLARKVSYFGAGGESYIEDYHAGKECCGSPEIHHRTL